MIRRAEPADAGDIVAMVHELATYEREPDAVALTERSLTAALFSPAPTAFCHVAVDAAARPSAGDSPSTGNGVAPVSTAPLAGFALWFVTFSTWTGKPGIHLEDLFVRPDRRRGGHGRALLAALAALCRERDYGRLEWSVLDWNTPAQSFYRSIGAGPLDTWTRWRMDGGALAALAPGDITTDGFMSGNPIR
jgi:GNAT superfamily N-acetyltransferase